jgi:hypothetical protein
MNVESKSVVIVYGENGIFGESASSIAHAPDHLGKVSRISKHAVRIRAAQEKPDTEFWIVGCDPFKNGYEEAIQMETSLLNDAPQLQGRTRTFNGLLDTSHQAEAISEALCAPEYVDANISVILPLEHKKRAVTFMKTFGASPARVYEAHREYVLEKGISRDEKIRRIEEIKEIYFTFDMYLNLLKELGGNVLGFVDPRGNIMRKISDRFRGQNSSSREPQMQVLYQV